MNIDELQAKFDKYFPKGARVVCGRNIEGAEPFIYLTPRVMVLTPTRIAFGLLGEEHGYEFDGTPEFREDGTVLIPKADLRAKGGADVEFDARPDMPAATLEYIKEMREGFYSDKWLSAAREPNTDDSKVA